jgi:pimeloyl-ACP methyl ester carboxylesterase
VASVVLLTGGYGKVGIYPNGSMDDTNFLTNSLGRLNALQVNALVMDSPSDKRTLDHFRHTAEHAQDLAAVVTHLKGLSNAPVWLVGISNGALSAAHGAAMAGAQGPDGVVLLSTLTKEGVSARAGSPVYRTSVNTIRVPVVLMHHKRDGCYVTPFEGVEPLKAALTQAPRVTVVAFEGGSNQGNPCHAGHHLFQGLEVDVIEALVQAIRHRP